MLKHLGEFCKILYSKLAASVKALATKSIPSRSDASEGGR